ncbi:ribonuclease HII [Clostridium sp. WILCCON 0269]|uniref:Ribonuclease HII n=1 Tax=Candidatus Clostridium eludens TaxID=3381663 RepID=A0ABW8SIT8_9CLOT
MAEDRNKIENLFWDNLEKFNFEKIKKEVNNLKQNYFNYDNHHSFMRILENLKMDKRKNVNNLYFSFYKFILNKKKEIERVKSMYKFDKRFGNYTYVAGTDEVGRGPLAGPIAAAAVILNLDYEEDSKLILGIKDSKKLTPKCRYELSEIIKEKALDYNIAVINNREIDKRGISWCNNEVLRRAVLGLKLSVDLVLSDGYVVRNLPVHNEFIIKGDSKSVSIASASIIAKVYRDELMKEYSKIYTQYNFQNNSGYGTKEHIGAIRKYGTCRIHRTSFLKNIV